MNRLRHLIFLDFKLLTKSKSFYLKLLLFPSVMILILGTVLGNNHSKFEAFDVAFYNEDRGTSLGSSHLTFGTVLQDTMLKSTTIKSLLHLQEVKSDSEGRSLINQGKVSVFIHIPADFSEALVNHSSSRVTVISANGNAVNKSIVKAVIERFIQTTVLTLAEQKTLIQSASSRSISKDTLSEMMHFIENEKTYEPLIPKVSGKSQAAPINAMQYYSIAMVVMFSIVTAFSLIHNIVDDRLNHTLFRIQSTPTLNVQYITGKLFGIVFAMTMQMLLVMAITVLIFRMKWGNVFDILLITAAYAFAIGSIVLLCGLLAKNHSSISSMASPLMYGLSFLGGSLISRDGLPDVLKPVQQIVPNGKAINSYLTICMGGGMHDIAFDLTMLSLIGLLFLGITLVVYNGKGWKNNADTHSDQDAAKAAV